IPIKKTITSSSLEITSWIYSNKTKKITSWKPEPNTLLSDRLSSMPDDILLHILACLKDTKYAVQTSVLSKRWRHLWTSVQDLYFHRKSFGRDSSFHYFVRAVLDDPRRLNCRVDRFWYYANPETTVLTQLTSYALSRGARELVIASHSYFANTILPDLSSGSPSLETLHVVEQLYIHRSSFGHSMIRLTSLHLRWVRTTSGSFGGCFDIFNIFPNLTNLSLSWCYLGGANLKITGPKIFSLKLDDVTDVGLLELSLPNLEVFEYCFTRDYGEVDDFWLINLPSLRHADLNVDPGGL
ncbi:hypothetical protein Tsubulata_034092, partial [Turnera subulata]